MTNDARVTAAIVMFHPVLDEVLESIEALQPQVRHVLLIDNGGADGLAPLLERFSEGMRIDYHRNSQNMGIAAALNQAIRVAKAAGQEFLLLLDQDSLVSADFIDRLLCDIVEAAEPGAVGIACPIIENRETGYREGPVLDCRRRPALIQSSGSLIRLAMFEELGMFCENFFIEYVDYEFSLRTLASRWTSRFVPGAVLLHRPGNVVRIRAWRRDWAAVCAQPDRHYYMVRNFLVVAARHGRRQPRLIWRMFIILVRTRIKALLIERDRAAKLCAWTQGICDAVRGHMGRRR